MGILMITATITTKTDGHIKSVPPQRVKRFGSATDKNLHPCILMLCKECTGCLFGKST